MHSNICICCTKVNHHKKAINIVNETLIHKSTNAINHRNDEKCVCGSRCVTINSKFKENVEEKNEEESRMKRKKKKQNFTHFFLHIHAFDEQKYPSATWDCFKSRFNVYFYDRRSNIRHQQIEKEKKRL